MNQLNKIRRAAATTIVVPVVLLAAACGSSTPTTTAPAAAPSQTTSAPSTSSTPSTSDTPSSSATSSSSTADASAAGSGDKAAFISALKAGSADATSAHVSATMSVSGQAITIEGDSKIDGSNPASQMKMGMGSMNLQLLLIDKKVYVKGLPNEAAGKWALFDESSTFGKQMAASAGSADPTKIYDQFEKGLTSAKKVGTETVEGEQMTKYQLAVDPSKVAGAAAAAAAGKLPASLDYLAWLDGKGHLRKVTVDVMGTKLIINMSKYGEPVEIKAPPASEVVKGKMA